MLGVLLTKIQDPLRSCNQSLLKRQSTNRSLLWSLVSLRKTRTTFQPVIERLRSIQHVVHCQGILMVCCTLFTQELGYYLEPIVGLSAHSDAGTSRHGSVSSRSTRPVPLAPENTRSSGTLSIQRLPCLNVCPPAFLRPSQQDSLSIHVETLHMIPWHLHRADNRPRCHQIHSHCCGRAPGRELRCR